MALLRPYPERDPLSKGKYTPVPVDTAFLKDLEQMHHLTPQIHWLHPRIFFRSTLRPCLPRSFDKCPRIKLVGPGFFTKRHSCLCSLRHPQSRRAKCSRSKIRFCLMLFLCFASLGLISFSRILRLFRGCTRTGTSGAAAVYQHNCAFDCYTRGIYINEITTNLECDLGTGFYYTLHPRLDMYFGSSFEGIIGPYLFMMVGSNCHGNSAIDFFVLVTGYLLMLIAFNLFKLVMLDN